MAMGRRRWLAFALLVAAALVLAVCAGRFGSLDGIKQKVRDDFPRVEQVSTDALAARLERGERIVLLDVRRADEFAVSHLPGAIRIEPGSDDLQLLTDLDPSTPIIAYCSVGYRSSQLVERLAERGHANIANLEGSIFEWAEKGYPLVQGEQQVSRVHPYSRAWSWLIEPELRAYSPAEALPSPGR